MMVVVGSFQGTVAIFRLNQLSRDGTRLPAGLRLLCAQVIVLGWGVQESLRQLGLKEVKAAVEMADVDALTFKHHRLPYAVPRALPYDYFLLSQLMYGHHFGALTKNQFQLRAQYLQPLVPWTADRDPRILFDWDYPFTPDQLAYLYNKGMAPFTSLAFYTMLNMAGGQLQPRRDFSPSNLLHTGLALCMVRLGIELSSSSGL